MKIILGAVISLPPYSPGMVWNRMHHAVGLQKLGHEVYVVEEVQPNWCVDAWGRRCDYEHSINRELFRTTMEQFGLKDRACQLYNHGQSTFGLSLKALEAVSHECDLLLNISGHVSTELILENVARRAYMDQDPVYTQLWNAEYGKSLNFQSHDVFLTVGLNIGTARSYIPDCGIKWHPILPPVVLDFWPFRVNPSCKAFTTIASWGGYGELCYRGEWYRSKYEEFRRFAELPRRVGQEFEIALKGYHDEDEGIRLLLSNNWVLSNAGQIAELSSYRGYIARSRGEIGIAKHAYVKGQAGWFSDRSADYLASGKPVLAQSTGFEHSLPTGRGLLSFSNLEEAVEGIEAINQDYAMHCRAARDFAEEYLDYRRVLPQILEVCTA